MSVPPPFAQTLHFDARNGSNEAALLHSSLRLGLLGALVEAGAEGVDQQALTQRLGCSVRGVRTLVEMLVGMGLARRERMTRVWATPALAGPWSHPEVRSLLEEATVWLARAGGLEEAVRSGRDLEGILSRYESVFRHPPQLDPASQDLWHRFAQSALRTRALIAAGRLGVLEAAATPTPSSEVADRLQLGRRGLEALRAALEGMGVFAPGEPLRYSEQAQPVFDPKGRAYFVRSMEVSARYWEALVRLDETIRDETYVLDLKDPVVSAEFYADNSSQISAVFASHFRLARQAANTLKTANLGPMEAVLDIGTGSGVWGGAFAATFPQAQVTYFDQASVFPQVKANLEKLKLDQRAHLTPGNLFTDSFGEARFDAIILPQVLNVLCPRDVPDLVGRAARALKPNGVLVIAEYVLTDQRDGPLDHLYFHFRRVITNEGDLLSFPEYAAILREVGLTQARFLPLPTQEIILAAREGMRLPEHLEPARS